MRAFLAGARIQIRFLTAYPDSLIPFFTAPLFTIIFLLVFKHAGRQDLTPYAAIAPVYGAHGECIVEPGQLEPAIRRAMAAVERGNLALLDVRLEP